MHLLFLLGSEGYLRIVIDGMNMKIYLIRHGESESDVKERYDGEYDDHLTEKGLDDAREVAAKLAGSGVQIIFSSPKIRALQTAEILARELKCSMLVKAGLAEQDIYGAYPDLSMEYPEEEYRRLGELLASHDEIEGVETREYFRDRVASCFSEIVETKRDVVAVVTHGGPIRAILRETVKSNEYGKIGNGCIIELEKENGKFVVMQCML